MARSPSSPVQSTILVTGGNVLVKAFAFLATVLMMRGFTPAEFGQIMVMVSLMSILPVFLDYGSGNSFLKFYPTMKRQGMMDRKAELLGATLLFRIVMGVILFGVGLLIARPLAELLLKSPDFQPVIVVALAGGCAGSCLQFFQVIFQSDEHFPRLIISQLLDAVLKAAGAAWIVAGMTAAGVFHGVAVYAAAPFLAAVLIAWVMGRNLPRPRIPDGTLLRRFFGFSSWYMVSAVGFMLFTNFDYLILAAVRPPEDVGYFASALRLGTMIYLVVQAINTVLMPYIGRVTEPEAMVLFFRKAQVRTLLLSLVVLPGVLAGPWLVRWIAGPQYAPAVSIYLWVALDQIAQLVFTPFMVVLFGLNRPRLLTLYVMLEMVLNIGGDLFVVGTWGPEGVAAVTLAVRLLVGIIGSLHLYHGIRRRVGFIRSVTSDFSTGCDS
ncbi:oligosaccharide flippase family protein [bacterium]|nr:oligosaccharide flippase family protein [candidate division CSSED10-310 bacterium]